MLKQVAVPNNMPVPKVLKRRQSSASWPRFDVLCLGPILAEQGCAETLACAAAQLWHPDKHPENAEEAKVKFQAIQQAYDSLMSTDEDARIEALAHK